MSKTTLKQKLAAAAGLIALIAAAESQAQTSQNLTVQATVPSFCIINTATSLTTLSFTIAEVNLTGPDYDADSRIDWRCSANTALTVQIDGGGTGDVTARQMTDGGSPANVIGYQLYQEAGRTTVFGDGTGGTAGAAETGLGMNTIGQTFVYGRIPRANVLDVPAGAYTDTVVVTLSF